MKQPSGDSLNRVWPIGARRETLKRSTVMKILGLALGLILALNAAPALAADQAPTLTVSGQGSVTWLPDLATLNVGITTTDDAAQNATSQNNATYAKVEDAMLALGIAKADLTTLNYNLNYVPRPQTAILPPQPYGPRYGYTVSRNVSIKLHDLNLTGKAIDAAVGAGASNLNYVNYGIENQQSAYAAALKLAVGDAANQAKAMAQAARLRLIRIQTMQSGYAAGPQPFPMRTMAALAAPVPTQLAPGGVTVRAAVTITYLVAPRN